jgi:hypothetical protein
MGRLPRVVGRVPHRARIEGFGRKLRQDDHAAERDGVATHPPGWTDDLPDDEILSRLLALNLARAAA